MTFDIGLYEVCVRVGVRYVITKFSRMDSLPNFLTHGAPRRALRARESSAMISSSVGMTVWVRGMALFASLISTFNPYFIAGPLRRYNYRGHPTGRLLYPLNYVVSLEFLQFCFQLGSYTERYILLWACATGVIAGSTCKSTFTPFIFPIPRNRSAYSINRLLVIVSSLWTVFATLTRPRSSAVWKPIKGSVFVCPFIT